MTTAIMEKQDIIEGRTTLVRRVSDLFRAEGTNVGSPSLLRRTSMQKLRHCCQNLNLFPILLYSFGHTKAPPMPITKINLAHLVATITERICRVYSSIRYTIIRGLDLESLKSITIVTNDKNIIAIAKNRRALEAKPENEKLTISTSRSERKFEKFIVKKPKSHSVILKFVVYLAPLLLAFQTIGLFSLIVIGKYSHGFVFLFFALIFLGCISMKVLNHDATGAKTFKRDKRKND